MTRRRGWLLVVFLLVSLPVAAFEMRAGVAKAAITNNVSRVMVNGRMSEGVARDIHARVLFLDDGTTPFIIVTYDLNCLDVATPLLRRRVRDELGIPVDRLVLLATHNHNAPIQINPGNFDYGAWLADRISDLIREAQAGAIGPAKVEFGYGDGYFVLSRGNAPTDYEIQVLKISVVDSGTGQQKPIALLFNHGTHPAQASVSKIDAGHPGFAMDIIEDRWPGVQAMYCDASGGNQFVARPEDFGKRTKEARAEGDEALDALLSESARVLGEKLADATLRIASGAMRDVTGAIRSSMTVLDLPLADPIPREEAERMARRVPKGTGLTTYPDKYRGTNWVRMLLDWYDRDLPFPKTTGELVCTDDTFLVHRSDDVLLKKYDGTIHDAFPCVYEQVIAASIGPMVFVAMQGEVCAPIGMRIKDAFRRDMPIFCTAYMGEHNLYIPTRELVRLKAYQGTVIQTQYASPVGWSPEVEDAMVDGVIALVEELLDGTGGMDDRSP